MRILAVAILCAIAGAGSAQQLQQPDPCDRKSRVVGDITYCDRYWECVAGTPQLYDCPNGLVFVGRNRGIAEGCDYPWRGAYCDSKKLANPPIATEHCDWLYGIFGHETSCTRYWTCWNGTATEQFCIGGLLYNEDTHACDWPENVQGCQKHPLCKENPNANVALGKSCERYWACQGGYPRLQRCPATLVFDKQSRRCVNPPTQDCDVPSTTPPPEEETGPAAVRSPSGPRPQRRRPVQQARPVQDTFIPNNELPTAPQRPQNFREQPQQQDFIEQPQQADFRQPPQGFEDAIPFIEEDSFQNTNPRPRPNVPNFRAPPIPGAIPLN